MNSHEPNDHSSTRLRDAVEYFGLWLLVALAFVPAAHLIDPDFLAL